MPKGSPQPEEEDMELREGQTLGLTTLRGRGARAQRGPGTGILSCKKDLDWQGSGTGPRTYAGRHEIQN